MALMDVPDLAATIRAVSRVLRTGGWFVFSIVHPSYHPHVEIYHRYRKPRPLDRLPEHAYLNELAHTGFSPEHVVEENTPGRPADIGGVPGLVYARTVRS
jgi:hypothetical protein